MLPPVTNGRETLIIEVDWVDRRRDHVTISHVPVHSPPVLIASGRDAEDLMRAIAQFLDYELERRDGGFAFKFKREEPADAAQGR